MQRKKQVISAVVIILAVAILGPWRESPTNPEPLKDTIKADEKVIFFPSAGRRSKDGNIWHLEVRGWIFEPEPDSFRRNRIIELASLYFDKSAMTAEGSNRFKQRMRYFLADNEGGKELTIQIAGTLLLLPESDGDGKFEKELKLPAEKVQQYAHAGKLPFHAISGSKGNKKTFKGTVRLLEPEGLTVISDLDDTIKISNVTDRKQLVENTFLKPYKPVADMAEKYRQWAEKEKADFIYLSASPWQLYPGLSLFLKKNGFPEGVVDLLRIELDDTRILDLFDKPEEKKLPRLERYIKHYPKRTFILIGDDGEKDPEIYGKLARAYPDRIRRIFIRSVKKSQNDPERLQKAFEGIPKNSWSRFSAAGQLQLTD